MVFIVFLFFLFLIKKYNKKFNKKGGKDERLSNKI